MSAYSLVISPIAQDDLKNISQFGIHNWSKSQSSKYLDTLKAHLWTLTEQPKMGVERDELLLNMRSFPVESHVIFYRLKLEQIEIIRILHGRQDPKRHIK